MDKDFISLKDLSRQEIMDIFSLAEEVKNNPGKFKQSLNKRCIGLLFEKPSLRTRVSFEAGIYQLGGYPIYLSPQEVQLGKRESVGDAAKTLSRYLDGVILRTFSHNTLITFAEESNVAVINGLTDLLHPAQALSDLYTIYKKKNNFKDIKIAFVGDGDNVCHSLMFGCAKLGAELFIAVPEGFEPDKAIISQTEEIAAETGAKVKVSNDIKTTVEDSSILYTDVWVSMGKEAESRERMQAFREFQINSDILSLAEKDCLVMHCLPAHRGDEITDEVIDSDNSIVFEQAENRLYVQKAILVKLLGQF